MSFHSIIVTIVAGTAYPSIAPEFTLGNFCVVFCRYLFALLSFFCHCIFSLLRQTSSLWLRQTEHIRGHLWWHRYSAREACVTLSCLTCDNNPCGLRINNVNFHHNVRFTGKCMLHSLCQHSEHIFDSTQAPVHTMALLLRCYPGRL
jgi:hypothetical protein